MELSAIPGIPLVQPGDDLEQLLVDGLHAARRPLADGDVLVIAQKLVSKAESRYAYLDEVVASARAHSLAASTEKDPRLVQLILDESKAVLRHRPGLIIVEHRCGWVMANAGIDHSNLDRCDRERVLLLPKDVDASCRSLRRGLLDAFGLKELGVIVCDSVGRPWRIGTQGMALSVQGLPGIVDRRGEADLFGRPLEVTQVGFADSVAAAAVLVMGEGREGLPVVLVRGLRWPPVTATSQMLMREPEAELVSMSVVALSGGVGGAKLALGLYRVLPRDTLTIVANVGDDFEHVGLHVSRTSTP